MFNLKVTKQNGLIEQSEFKTNQEAIDWQVHLGEIGYVDCVFEISEIKAPIADISPRQIRMALLNLGLVESSIDTAIGSLPSPQKELAMIAWKYSTTFKREAEAVSMIGSLLNLSSEQLDNLWKAAAVL